MGYTTDFEGAFVFEKPLTIPQATYLNLFAGTRRMKRNADIMPPDGTHIYAHLPLGEFAEYYVDGKGFAGQDREDSILDYNSPPPTQPSLWCNWVTNYGEHCRDTAEAERTLLFWNGNEKFYNYVEWLEYIIDNFIIRWENKLNGVVVWKGELDNDMGRIRIVENHITVKD